MTASGVKAVRRARAKVRANAAMDLEIADQVAELSPEEEVFVNTYVEDPTNARAAARRARPDLSQNGAALEATANRYLTRAAVADAIARRMQDKENESKASVQRVLFELAAIGFANIDWFTFDETTGEWSLKDGVPEYAWRAVSERICEVTETYNDRTRETRTKRVGRLKFWNKNDALLTIAKHLGMITTRLANADGSNLLGLDQVRKIVMEAMAVTPNEKEDEDEA